MPFGVLVVVYHATATGGDKDKTVHDTPLSLLAQNLLDLADHLLHFADALFSQGIYSIRVINIPPKKTLSST